MGVNFCACVYCLLSAGIVFGSTPATSTKRRAIPLVFFFAEPMDAPAGAKVLRSAARKPPSKKWGKETENSAEKFIFALRNALRNADSAGANGFDTVFNYIPL